MNIKTLMSFGLCALSCVSFSMTNAPPFAPSAKHTKAADGSIYKRDTKVAHGTTAKTSITSH